MGTPEKLAAMPAVERAQTIAQERDFLHWELAFPEVFFDENGQSRGARAGFDAVIGNPPYDELSEDAVGHAIDEMRFIESSTRLKPALGYRINLHRLFIAQALELTRQDGWHGFIVPLSLLADQFTQSLRKELLQHVQFKIIEHMRLATDTTFIRLGDIAEAVPGELMTNKQFDPYLSDPKAGEEII